MTSFKISNYLRLFLFLFLLTPFLFNSDPALAREKESICKHRYLTLVNPVRGRNLWRDRSISPLINQYSEVASHDFSATWLLQYDAVKDDEITEYIKNEFSENQELGVFLEISPSLAMDSRVIYPHAVAWDDPNAVFFSGYSCSERRMMINKLFSKFKETFGYYPKSVGAWWIDSYSLNYMVDKFSIKSALIVADQKTTDDYGVWGQWWGYPYSPSKANILTPAKNEKDKLNLVIIQWAQRDLSKAYGEGISYSNFSLQANDYLERGLNTNYFLNLASRYLDCDLGLGQITVGLETGMESVSFGREYGNQLKTLKSINGLRDVTMSEFSDVFNKKYKINPEEVILKGKKSKWILTPDKRINRELKDSIVYQDNLAFSDYFIADKSKFLDRRLPIEHQKAKSIFFPFLWLIPFIVGLVWMIKTKLARYIISIYGFILVSFLPLLRSHLKFGWKVFYGPVVNNIYLTQLLVVSVYLILLLLFIKIVKSKIKDIHLFFLILPLSYFLDFIIQGIRYTQVEGVKYFGFAWDALRLIGFSKLGNYIGVVNKDFSSVVAGSMLRFKFDKIWENPILSFIIYPIIHIIFSLLLFYLMVKVPRKIRYGIVILISIPFLFFVYFLMTLDPRIVL